MPTIPPWLIAILANLPAIIADIESLIAAISGNPGGTPTPAQEAQLAAYRTLLNGASMSLAFHVNN